MKCQIPFTGKNKKNIINLSSAENAQRVVKVKQFVYLVPQIQYHTVYTLAVRVLVFGYLYSLCY